MCVGKWGIVKCTINLARYIYGFGLFFLMFCNNIGSTKAVHPDTEMKHIRYAHTPSHWSTADSLRQWADEILIPHVKAKRIALRLPDTQV